MTASQGRKGARERSCPLQIIRSLLSLQVPVGSQGIPPRRRLATVHVFAYKGYVDTCEALEYHDRTTSSQAVAGGLEMKKQRIEKIVKVIEQTSWWLLGHQ